MTACGVSAVVLLATCSKEEPSQLSPPAPQRVFFSSADGVRLAATVYPVRKEKSPGLLLLHMLGSTRDAWEPLARRAQEAGFLCLAVDLRGHGESTRKNDSRLSYRTLGPGDWRAALQDIQAAHRELLAHGADPENLAIVGADLGANLALLYAADHADIQAVVMLSPGLEYKGIAALPAIATIGLRPILLIAATGDAYSASSCLALKQQARGFCELREYVGVAHGTDLLSAENTAIEQILLWLSPIIAPGAMAERDVATANE